MIKLVTVNIEATVDCHFCKENIRVLDVCPEFWDEFQTLSEENPIEIECPKCEQTFELTDFME